MNIAVVLLLLSGQAAEPGQIDPAVDPDPVTAPAPPAEAVEGAGAEGGGEAEAPPDFVLVPADPAPPLAEPRDDSHLLDRRFRHMDRLVTGLNLLGFEQLTYATPG